MLYWCLGPIKCAGFYTFPCRTRLRRLCHEFWPADRPYYKTLPRYAVRESNGSRMMRVGARSYDGFPIAAG